MLSFNYDRCSFSENNFNRIRFSNKKKKRQLRLDRTKSMHRKVAAEKKEAAQYRISVQYAHCLADHDWLERLHLDCVACIACVCIHFYR